MRLLSPLAAPALAAVFGFAAAPALAQQQGGAEQSQQGSADQQEQGQQQGPPPAESGSGETGSAGSRQSPAPGGSQHAGRGRILSEPIVIVDFIAVGAREDDLITAMTELAREPYVAEVTVSSDADARPSGVLLFRSIDAYEEWRSNEMGGFFDALGTGTDLQMTIEMVRPNLLRRGTQGAFDGVEVEYVNENNEAPTGDADIDAITVICAGDAYCNPSN